MPAGASAAEEAECAPATPLTPPELLDRLLEMHGPQDWWPGEDAFEIAVGAILTQRTSWRNAARAIENLRAANCLGIDALLRMGEGHLQELLKPCGFYRVKAARLTRFCRWLAAHGGFPGLGAMSTPALREALLGVHGIGPETADAILLYACERPVFVVDAYAYRLFGRLGLIDALAQRNYEVVRRRVECALGADSSSLSELHALVVRHGQTFCRPKPLCEQCRLRELCPSALPAHAAAVAGRGSHH